MKRAHIARGLVAATLAAAAFAQAPRAGAWVGIGGTWNTSALPVPYRINLTTIPASLGSATGQSAVDNGFGTWAAAPCTSWRAMDAGTSTDTSGTAGDGQNSILWISGTWPAELGDVNVTIGVTTPLQQSTRTGERIVEADIRFNNVGFRWSTTGASNTVDAQSIATHEEGHFLGLGHTTVARAIMYASYSGGIKRTLDADDQTGVCTLYPNGVTPPADAGVVTDAGSGGGDVGDTCSDTVPCAAANECVCDNSTGSCFCSRACSSSEPCPTGFQCADTSIGPLCVPGGSSGGDAGTSTGSGATGDPCDGPSACSSGLCAQTPDGCTFCSQVCTSDANCPTGYRCFGTATAGTMVCGPASGMCGTTTPDAGTTTPDASVEDSGTHPMADAGTGGDAAAGDAGREGARDAGTGTDDGGCGCAVPGSGGARANGLAAMAALAALFAARRRRSAR